MKKSALALIPLLAAAPLCSASALGSFGARAGYGLHFSDSDPTVKSDGEPTSFVGGAAWKLDVLVAAVEVDLLYRRAALEVGDTKFNEDRFSVGALGRFSIPIVPLFFSLDLVGGLEPRFFVTGSKGVEDDAKAMTLYLPVGVGASLDLQLIDLNLDMRYERQLTPSLKSDEDARSHNLTFLAGVFF